MSQASIIVCSFLILGLTYMTACTNNSSGGSQRTKKINDQPNQASEEGGQNEASETSSGAQSGVFPGHFKLATWQGPVALEQSLSAAADLAYVFFDSSDKLWVF